MSAFTYNPRMSVLRDLVYLGAAAVSSPVWGYRLLSTGKWRTDWPARFGRCALKDDVAGQADRPTIMIHAVSVGEVNAIRHLVDELERSRLAHCGTLPRVIISVTTDTGTARARSLFQLDHDVVRFPFDFSPCVNRFLDAVRPDIVALTELEVWPNFVAACDKRGIPVCVINGRLTERSFKGYRKIAPLLRPTFSRLTRVAVQNEAIGRRFKALGVPDDRVDVLDTMKWDTARIADEVEGADELAHDMGIDRSRPVIVAGSTGPGEEKLLFKHCPDDVQLVIVPRKPERFEEVAALCPSFVRRSLHKTSPQAQSPTPDASRFFLLDTMGELRKAYALADVVIVGRSFLGLYGSDMMEPIALGRPTIIGPDHSDFAHIMDALIAENGIVVTKEPMKIAQELLTDSERAHELARRGREVIRKHQGSTKKHCDMLLNVLDEKLSRKN